MTQNLTHDTFNDREDFFSAAKQDISKVFYDHNLTSFTNPSDIGFLDFGNNNIEDQGHLNDLDNQHVPRFPHTREDPTNRFESFMNPSYSPIRPHHNPTHYPNHHNLGGNYHANGPRHSYPQEHAVYGGYQHHPQNYYYPNPYESHFMQPMHENPIDSYMDTHDESLSSMLCNDPAKNYNKHKQMTNGGYVDPNNMRKQHNQHTYGYGNYEQDNEEEIYHDYKRNPMMKIQPEMLRPSANHGKPLGGINMNPGDLDLKASDPKRIAGALRYSRPDPNPRKLSGKMDNYMDDEDNDDGDDFGEGKGRSTRGLRILSLKVKEIVTQKKRTSYKEVAESLTYELRQKMTARSVKEESKDEQNVKRRVYDALNVLIAADVLRKEGKVVYCEESMSHVGSSNKKKSKEDKDKLHFELLEARKKNKQKVEVLHELIFKCLAIKNLVKTNKARFEAEGGLDANKPKTRPSNVNATRIEVVQENPALKPKNEDVIRFPFIVLLSSSPENSMNLNMDTSQKQLAIESKKPFNIFGDIDVLLKMGLHYVSKEMFDQNIPHELQKYVPKYYLAALK